ncbi:unnamed protein product [Closterium sp. Naga37s-1]|nr:unnamed protein product [Closterium sp. Naga37s-1]
MACRAVNIPSSALHPTRRVSTANGFTYGHAYGSTYRTRFRSLRPDQKPLQARPAGPVPTEPVRRGSLPARQPGAVDDVAATETELSLPLAPEGMNKADDGRMSDGEEAAASVTHEASNEGVSEGTSAEVEGTPKLEWDEREGKRRAEEHEESGSEKEQGREDEETGKEQQRQVGRDVVVGEKGAEGKEEEIAGREDGEEDEKEAETEEAEEAEGDAAVRQVSVTESLGLGDLPATDADIKAYVRKWSYDALVLLQEYTACGCACAFNALSSALSPLHSLLHSLPLFPCTGAPISSTIPLSLPRPLQADGEPSSLDRPSFVEAAAREGAVALHISLPAIENPQQGQGQGGQPGGQQGGQQQGGQGQQVGWRVYEAVRAVGTLSAMGLRVVLCSSSPALSAFVALSFLTFAGRQSLAQARAAVETAVPDAPVPLQPWQQCVDLLSALDTPRVSAMAQAVYERRRDTGAAGGPADDWAQAQLQYVQQLVAASAEGSADIPLAVSEVVFHKAAAAARVQIDHHKTLAEAAMDAAGAARRAATVTEERSDALEAQIAELEFLVSQLSSEKDAGSGEAQAAVARVKELEETIQQGREREARAAEAAQAAKERLAFVTRQSEILKSKVDAEKQEVAAVRERVGLLTGQLKDAEQREEAARKAAGEMAENMTRLVSTLRNEVAELKAEVAAAEARERELEAALEDGGRQLRAALEAEAVVGALRADAERAEQELEGMAGRAGDLLTQVAQGRQVAAQLEAQVAEGQQLAARLADEVDRAKKAVGEGEKKQAELARDVGTLRATLTRIQADDQQLAQEAQLLAQESSLLKKVLVGVSGLAVLLPLLLLLLLQQPAGGVGGESGGGSGEVRGGVEKGREQVGEFGGKVGGGGEDEQQGRESRFLLRREITVEAADVAGGGGELGMSGGLREVNL